MMNKKMLAIVGACALTVALAGCGSSAPAATAAPTAAPTEEPAGYTGSQTATATGMGEVSVTITFENGVVTACDVDASNETDTIGQVAAPTVAQAIIDNNTPEVDGVSGATVTSTAIKTASEACFDAAGIAY